MTLPFSFRFSGHALGLPSKPPPPSPIPLPPRPLPHLSGQNEQGEQRSCRLGAELSSDPHLSLPQKREAV